MFDNFGVFCAYLEKKQKMIITNYYLAGKLLRGLRFSRLRDLVR